MRIKYLCQKKGKIALPSESELYLHTNSSRVFDIYSAYDSYTIIKPFTTRLMYWTGVRVTPFQHKSMLQHYPGQQAIILVAGTTEQLDKSNITRAHQFNTQTPTAIIHWLFFLDIIKVTWFSTTFYQSSSQQFIEETKMQWGKNHILDMNHKLLEQLQTNYTEELH